LYYPDLPQQEGDPKGSPNFYHHGNHRPLRAVAILVGIHQISETTFWLKNDKAFGLAHVFPSF
jgi:hypothetical protein